MFRPRERAFKQFKCPRPQCVNIDMHFVRKVHRVLVLDLTVHTVNTALKTESIEREKTVKPRVNFRNLCHCVLTNWHNCGASTLVWIYYALSWSKIMRHFMEPAGGSGVTVIFFYHFFRHKSRLPLGAYEWIICELPSNCSLFKDAVMDNYIQVFFPFVPGYRRRYRDWLRGGRSKDRIPEGATFSLTSDRFWRPTIVYAWIPDQSRG